MTVITLIPITLVFAFLQNTSPPALPAPASNNPSDLPKEPPVATLDSSNVVKTL
jgi:hypothetical protein